MTILSSSLSCPTGKYRKFGDVYRGFWGCLCKHQGDEEHWRTAGKRCCTHTDPLTCNLAYLRKRDYTVIESQLPHGKVPTLFNTKREVEHQPLNKCEIVLDFSRE